MVGMTTMLLRVLFSTRPAVLRDCCLRRGRKKEKSVMDTRCRCEKCRERKRARTISVPAKEEEITDVDLGSTSVTDRQGHPNPEEIVLKVTHFHS